MTVLTPGPVAARGRHRIVVLGLAAWTWAGAFPAGPVRGAGGVAATEPEGTFSNPSLYGKLTSDRWSWDRPYERRDLTPVPQTNPHPEPQPDRDHPTGVALSPDGTRAWVSLAGDEERPGHEVAVFDLGTRQVVRRIEVGSSPGPLELDPSGRTLTVLNRFSNYASVIDTTRDQVVDEIPLDFYCESMLFSVDGSRAWVANRYLDQVLVLEADGAGRMRVRPRGGFDPVAFGVPGAAGNPPDRAPAGGTADRESDGRDGSPSGDAGSIHALLRQSCGTARCHDRSRGGYYAGEDRLRSLFSAAEFATPGSPEESLLLRAVRPVDEGGFADDLAGNNFHAGGRVVWRTTDPGYRRVAAWIERSRPGPGIPVGNFGSKPGPMVLSGDGRHLFVGSLGTQEISVIDVEAEEEVTGIYLQNLTLALAIHHGAGGRELLIAGSLGVGFGAPRERDPFGGETEDRDHPAAQFTVLRDPDTTEPRPLDRQQVLGPFDAIDGTAAFKMGDIQNDITVVRLDRIVIPDRGGPGRELRHVLRANRYEAHDHWVRYTSDSAEILPRDIQGDIPPELQRVVGAFPADLAVSGDRLFAVMTGTGELVEWAIDPAAADAAEVLRPVAVYPTGVAPVSVAVGRAGTPAQGLVLVANSMGETLTVIDTRTGRTDEYPVGNLDRPFPDSDAERGQMFVGTAVFSVDQDTACVSCHIHDKSDGRSWGAGQAIAQMPDGTFVSGGLLGIPQLRNLFATQPFYFEGTHTAYDAQFDDAREHVSLQGFLGPNAVGDFTGLHHPRPRGLRPDEHEEIQDKMSTAPWGPEALDLHERRDEMIRTLTMRHFGKAWNFRDFQRFIGEYQAASTRLVPNPYDRRHPSVVRGRLLFNGFATGCVACHKPPAFTDKSEELTHNANRVLPPVISFTRRERSFTLVSPHWMDRVNGFQRDLEPWETGRVERVEGMVTTFPLRGLFDRPFAFLHHGRALSIRETILTPGHDAARRFRYPPLRGGEEIRPDRRERGFNELSFLEERTYMPDTHGGTSQLTVRQIQDLENFLLSIE